MEPFKLSYFFDNIVINKEITVEPYLRNVAMIKTSDDQSKILSKYFDS
jgi:hypothetical protein